MKKQNLLTILLFIITFHLPCVGQQNLTARQIMEKSREATLIDGLESISTLRIIDKRGRERIRKTAMASKSYPDGTEKRIVHFLSPADIKGTGMLIFDYKNKDDAMWIYLPAIRKTRRIISKEKSTSFMGSEFSKADMSAPNLDDFTFEINGETTVDNFPCYEIELKPKTEKIADDYGFFKKVMTIDKENFVFRKALYYNNFDELTKILVIKKIKLLDKEKQKYMATNMVMENKENGRRSVMIIDNMQYNPKVKEEYFTIRYLESMD